MEKFVKVLLSFFVMFILSVDTSNGDVDANETGGMWGNLIPKPKFLKGKIIDKTYYMSPEGDFRVELPHPPAKSGRDSNEWTYTIVQEFEDAPIIVGVIFGPAMLDWNIYHAVLVKRPIPKKGDDNVSATDDKNAYVGSVFSNKTAFREKSGGAKLEQVHFAKDTLNGSDFYYAVYKNELQYLVLSLVDKEKRFFMIEVDIPLKGPPSNTWPSLDELRERKFDIYNRMVDSFITDIK